MKNLLFSLLIFSTVFSQEFSVKFKFFKSHPHESRHMTKNFTLLQNDNYSSFELDNINDVNQFKFHENAIVFTDGDTLKTYLINNGKTIVQLYKEKVFKDFKLNKLVYNPFAVKSCQIIEDKIDIFNWELIDNNDTIIANYKCKKAITKFRGRDYVAYYTNEIANQGGPWKFDGLPGFILKVYSKDGFISIFPSEII